MKVNIYTTVEVTDEERRQIAAEIDGEGGKRRAATRDEMKEFIWTEGKNWRNSLANAGKGDETAEPASDISESAEAHGEAVTVTDDDVDEDDLL